MDARKRLHSRPESGLFRRAWQRMYRIYGVRRGIHLGRNVHLGVGTILWAPKAMTVGNEVYIGKYCTIECDGSIGDFTMLGNQVGIVGRLDHDFREVGKPVRYARWIGDDVAAEGDHRVEIGVDVWIGYGAIVLSGVRIGRGAIVAAGAVVSRDVECYQIVAGVPALPVAKRFADASIEAHERLLYSEFGLEPTTQSSNRIR